MRLAHTMNIAQRSGIRIALVFFVMVLVSGSFPGAAGAAPKTHAQTASTRFTVSATAQPNPITPGQRMTVKIAAKNSGSVLRPNAKLTVLDPSGKLIHSKTWLRQPFAARQTRNLSSMFALKANAPAGRYTVGVSIPGYYSQARVTTFTVQAHAPTSTPTPTATPEPVAAPAPPTPEAIVEPVTQPISMPPSGQTIQQMVDAAAPGAVVTVPAGVYRETVWISKPLTLSGAPGAVIDGESRNRWIVAAAHDVTIQGFEMRNSVNEQYWGAITQNANNVAYDRLTVQNNTFIGASYSPIATKLGAGHKILNNVFRDNGALGIRIDSGSGHLIAGNTIYNTNLANAFDSGWEAGGIKVSGNYGGVQNMVIENNEIYNNHGPAIWVDVDGDGFTIRGNRLHHNTRSGITFELSFNARIHDNVVWENGHGYNEWGWGAGILVQSSSGVEVFNNTVAWNADGIAVISQDRGAARWNAVNNNSVYDNTIALVHDGSYNTYALGWLQDWNGQLTSPSSNNRGWGNRYWLPTADGSELRYRWGESYYFKLGDFMSTPGESNARYLSTADNDQLLSTAGVPTSTSRAIASAPIETQEHLALPAAAVAEDPPNEVLQFSETGFALSNAFEAFWNRSGGIPVFGYPLTGELTELNSDTSKAHTVQYLERQRFEYHSDLAGTPYEVLMGRLGVQAAERGGLLETEPFQPLASDPDDNDCLFFAETGHTLCGRFLNYWQRHGLDMGDDGVSYRESLALFGLPISEVFIDPDTGLTSQYFERAIFQHHPDNDGTPYEVLLVRLGAQELSDGAS